MDANNFLKLVNGITNKDFKISGDPELIEPEKEYIFWRKTPIHSITVSFKFKAPKNEESFIRTFINNYCSKYREPSPKSYNGRYGRSWDKMSEEDRDFAHLHHSSHMKNKETLLEEIKTNLEKSDIEAILLNYGFYHTNYGLGIFVLFAGTYEMSSINKMRTFLESQHFIFSNEFSDKRWVYRFKLNLSKDLHLSILKKFHSFINSN
jgi:hypothetical protein